MTAYVIKIGDRYFYKFGKNGRTLTAWSLAGAMLFQVGNNQKRRGVETKLLAKGIAYTVETIGELP